MSASENMVNISFRASKEDKHAAEKVCKQLGHSMSTALNIFIKAVGREQLIPFDLTLAPFYAPENMAYIKKQIEDVHNGTITLEEHDLIEDWICANYYGHPMHNGKTIITQKEKSPVIGLFFYDENMNEKHVYPPCLHHVYKCQRCLCDHKQHRTLHYLRQHVLPCILHTASFSTNRLHNT